QFRFKRRESLSTIKAELPYASLIKQTVQPIGAAAPQPVARVTCILRKAPITWCGRKGIRPDRCKSGRESEPGNREKITDLVKVALGVPFKIVIEAYQNVIAPKGLLPSAEIQRILVHLCNFLRLLYDVLKAGACPHVVAHQFIVRIGTIHRLAKSTDD